MHSTTSDDKVGIMTTLVFSDWMFYTLVIFLEITLIKSHAFQPISPASVWLFSHASGCHINTVRPRQNGRHFADDTFKCIFLNENAWISLKISQKFVPKVRITNILALVQIMAWRQPGDKPLSEPMMVSLLMHICVTRPQWVKWHR